jgi:predicted acetyltransferase
LAFPGPSDCYTGWMELRPATREEFDAFSIAALSAFHREYTDADRERYGKIDEPERSLAWFDDGRIVATTMAFTRRITVPGGVEVPCAGVTAVAVVPTHRRRGLLTSMMRRQLSDIRDAGEPVAALWASEGAIYGRFGYGVGASHAHLVARRPAARLAAAPERDEPLRAGPAGEHVGAMRSIHDRVRAQRPGMLARPGPWWQDRLHDPEHDRQGAQPLRAAIAGDGYAIYAGLWSFLLDQDLTRTISWSLAPVDEPLWLMATDPRSVRRTIGDGLWVRVVDVAAALSARSYSIDTDVVLEVTDAFCPWNEGRYRLSGGTCERTDAAPDLALDVSALGAAYLGGTTLHELAAAGRVQELRSGALVRASAALRGDVAPWCPEVF